MLIREDGSYDDVEQGRFVGIEFHGVFDVLGEHCLHRADGVRVIDQNDVVLGECAREGFAWTAGEFGEEVALWQ